MPGISGNIWLANKQEVIEGFVLNEDKLDLSDLIDLDNTTDLEKYLSITSDKNDTTISVNIDGTNEVSQTITPEGVDLSSELQHGQGTVINKLFNNIANCH